MSATPGRKLSWPAASPWPQAGTDDLERLVQEVTRIALEELQAAAQMRAQSPTNLFHSDSARLLKEEISAVGRKLWDRQYVDGAGGNISARVGDEHVLCTPTLRSKSDVTPDDVCMVDLGGTLVAGHRPRTSEVLLHLEGV